MRLRTLALVVAVLAYSAAEAQERRTPSQTVDAFHAALRDGDAERALALLDPGLIVFEAGSVDRGAEAYALHHLPHDIQFAAAARWRLETRRAGGAGAERWVLSTYRVTGKAPDGKPIDQTTVETAIVRRAGDSFRIVHLHWSSRTRAR